MCPGLILTLDQIMWQPSTLTEVIACRSGDGSSTELSHILQTSSHATFKQLLQPLLIPCLQSILAYKQDSQGAQPAVQEPPAPHRIPQAAETCHDMQERGRAWVLLGMLRLHLAAPPAGADPVGKYAYKKAHFDRLLAEDVLPETQVSFLRLALRHRLCMFCVFVNLASSWARSYSVAVLSGTQKRRHRSCLAKWLCVACCPCPSCPSSTACWHSAFKQHLLNSRGSNQLSSGVSSGRVTCVHKSSCASVHDKRT